MGKLEMEDGMSMTKAAGNMYEWVTHVHSHLRGQCLHRCPYCYVQSIDKRFGSRAHQGPVRIDERALRVRYGPGKTIFVEHAGDLFAEGVPEEFISRILGHCSQWPENTYVFQTKNPETMLRWRHAIPPRRVLGVTVESDTEHVGNTPTPLKRMFYAWLLGTLNEKTFITVEPVLRFSSEFADDLAHAAPSWINIGADSKRTPGLKQPTLSEVWDLVNDLRRLGVEVREKDNLKYLA
jgi:protein gp37